jgi:hypothetical protein
VFSTRGATLDEYRDLKLDLRGVFDAPTAEAFVRSIGAGHSVAAPAHRLDSILNALLGLGDEWMRWISGAWDDRNRG